MLSTAVHGIGGCAKLMEDCEVGVTKTRCNPKERKGSDQHAQWQRNKEQGAR